MLHLSGDSGYKLSIDKSPVYSIIYINKCADGKKYHTIPTVQRAAVWCKAVSVSCGKSSRSSLPNGYNAPVSSAGCSRYRAGLCWKPVRGCAQHANESGTAESLMLQGLCLLKEAGDKGFFFFKSSPPKGMDKKWNRNRSNTMQLNGSQIFVEVLCEQGVDTLFGYPGGAVLNLYDELYKNADRITHVLTAHEQGAAHAADGYARATGRTGVVLATSGPGATNLVTGIATAYMDSVPMVAFTGNVATGGIGRDSFQEAYIEGITLPITKHNFTVRRVEDLADTMRAAFRIAQSGRKGPVLVDIPKDVTAAVCEFTPKQPEPIRTVTTYNEEQVHWAADLINAAQRPLVYFGGGVRSAASCQPLRDLLHKAEIPATYTLMAAGVVPYGDPMNLGMLGMHGCYTSNRAVAECDVLIAVGTRFSDRVALNPKTFAKNATIIQIDIDASELGKNVDVDLSIVGDAAYVLNAMLPQIKPAKHPDWMKMIQSWQAQDYHPVSDPTRLMPHQVIGEVCNQCGPEAVYVTDVGQHQMWAAQYLRHTKSRGFITSGGLGTMGFGYGAAIGAQMALGRQQRVVMFTGDGSFHMNLNEACTAVSYELPIITVIFNNSVLGMVRQWQTSFYGKRYSQTDPHRKTDFVKLADGFGLKGYRCTNLPEFQEAFADALQQKGPTWIECIIDKDEKVLPMIPGGGDINDIIME